MIAWLSSAEGNVKALQSSALKKQHAVCNQKACVPALQLTCIPCRRDDGVGLAAPQVGVNVRLMVYNPTGRRGEEEFILVNPRILNASKKRESAEEGCLSFPRIFADVEVSVQPSHLAADLGTLE